MVACGADIWVAEGVTCLVGELLVESQPGATQLTPSGKRTLTHSC